MAGLMGFLRGLFGGAKGPQEGKTTGHAGLSADAARAALSELTGGGAATLRLFDAAIAGNLPKNRPFDPGDDGQVSMGVAIMAALHAARRAVCLDWAEGAQVACTAFGQHFGPAGHPCALMIKVFRRQRLTFQKDCQFKKQLRAADRRLRSEKHPSSAPRPAPTPL